MKAQDRYLKFIRWEEADGQSFPHLYGPLSLDAVISVQAFST